LPSDQGAEAPADLRRQFADGSFRKAEARIEQARQTAIELLEELVAVPSVNPPGNQYYECALLLAERLRDRDLQPHLAAVPRHELERLGLPPDRPRPALIAVLGKDHPGAPTLHFHGHYDVVPADNESAFRLRIRGDEAWGRGTAYMKGGLVSLLLALEALKPVEQKLAGRILLSIVPDEITGGDAGTAHLFRCGALPENSLGMLSPEPTGGVIWNGNRGAISQLLTVGGQAAHVAVQHQGRNAFEGLLDLGCMLREVKALVESRRFGNETSADPQPPSVLLLGGMSRSGTNFSVVPESASFTIDRRFDPRESQEAVAQELEDLYQRFRDAGWTLDVRYLQSGAASLTPADLPLTRTLQEVVGLTIGNTPALALCPGILESRFFLERGTPGLAYGPGSLHLSHTPDERVSMDSILTVARVYARTAWALLGPR
jgi:acetylornithine deacetylase/succinyl-diaminopimelate desuccinylase-like protein